MYCFPQHKKTALFQTYSDLRLTPIHTIPFYTPARHSHAHQHTNLSLFLTVLNNICPSTPISGHNAIPPIFCYRYNRGFTSYTSSSCSSGSLATLLALLCKYLSSFINATPSFLAVLLSTAFSPITYPITLFIKWNTFLLNAVHHFSPSSILYVCYSPLPAYRCGGESSLSHASPFIS